VVRAASTQRREIEPRRVPQLNSSALDGLQDSPNRLVKRSRFWFRRIRRIWAVLGSAAFVIFTGWSVIAYRASSTAHAALQSDTQVQVTQTEDSWTFTPKEQRGQLTSLLFFPGALVSPVAYAPLARAVAIAGFSATILKLPRRGAFGGAEDPRLFARARALMTASGGPNAWVVAGHSRGAVVATQLASRRPKELAGLVFIESSHPRDVSLAALEIPVAKIVGTRDGLASPDEINANRRNLPASTYWVWVEGGNHSRAGHLTNVAADKHFSDAASPRLARSTTIVWIPNSSSPISAVEPT
jgi:surfactin synthase thioesterase subunit